MNFRTSAVIPVCLIMGLLQFSPAWGIGGLVSRPLHPKQVVGGEFREDSTLEIQYADGSSQLVNQEKYNELAANEKMRMERFVNSPNSQTFNALSEVEKLNMAMAAISNNLSNYSADSKNFKTSEEELEATRTLREKIRALGEKEFASLSSDQKVNLANHALDAIFESEGDYLKDEKMRQVGGRLLEIVSQGQIRTMETMICHELANHFKDGVSDGKTKTHTSDAATGKFKRLFSILEGHPKISDIKTAHCSVNGKNGLKGFTIGQGMAAIGKPASQKPSSGNLVFGNQSPSSRSACTYDQVRKAMSFAMNELATNPKMGQIWIARKESDECRLFGMMERRPGNRYAFTNDKCVGICNKKPDEFSSLDEITRIVFATQGRPASAIASQVSQAVGASPAIMAAEASKILSLQWGSK